MDARGSGYGAGADEEGVEVILTSGSSFVSLLSFYCLGGLLSVSVFIHGEALCVFKIPHGRFFSISVSVSVLFLGGVLLCLVAGFSPCTSHFFFSLCDINRPQDDGPIEWHEADDRNTNRKSSQSGPYCVCTPYSVPSTSGIFPPASRVMEVSPSSFPQASALSVVLSFEAHYPLRNPSAYSIPSPTRNRG